MTNTDRINRFTEKIQQTYGFSYDLSRSHAENILQNIPDALIPNIDEWCAGNCALTNIYIGKYSLPMLLHLWNSNDFIDAAQALIEYERDPDKGEGLIWRIRR